MDEDLPTPASPPLPKKGVYNIDFDNLDEFSNPFEAKGKLQLGSSPPIQSNNAYQFDENEDPFKSKKTLANSPPGSPKVTSRHSEDNLDIANEGQGRPPDDCQSQEPEKVQSVSDENKTNSQVTPKKKKVIKKPQVQSKFKPPKNVKKQNNGDIDIIMPEMESFNNNNKTTPVDDFATETTDDDHQSQAIPAEDAVITTKHNVPVDLEDDGPPPQDAAPDAMAMSTEIDQKFIEQDELDDQINDGLGGLHEEFKDARDWTAPSHVQSKVNESPKMDYLHQSEKTNSVTPPSRSGIERPKKSGDESFGVSSSNQVLSDSSREKHPAARVLEKAQGDDPFIVGKSESSSEEGPFYDAIEFAPAAISDMESQQNSVSPMEKNRGDMQTAEKKDTVVQLVQVLRYSQTDWNKMKQELELNFQTNLLNKERDWSRLLADRDKKISSLEETNKKLKSTNEDMRAVVTEFEKTIAQLQSEKEKMKNESHKAVEDLEGERNQALEDLASVESAFSDLHRRYEKSKTIIEGFKRNEEQLKECMEDLKSKLKKSESKLTSLRSQAEEKLDKANEDIDKIKKSTKSEVARLEAALKKSDLRISSLDEALSRKEKENQELTAICDELIAKVGS